MDSYFHFDCSHVLKLNESIAFLCYLFSIIEKPRQYYCFLSCIASL